MASGQGVGPIAWAALVAFTLQNSASQLWSQYLLQQYHAFSMPASVLLQECAVKLPMSLVLLTVEAGGLCRALGLLVDELQQYPASWAEAAIPAIIYTLGANLQLVGIMHLGTAVAVVLFQTKILLTGVFSRLILNRRISCLQWLSLVLLTVGVLLVILREHDPKRKPKHAANGELLRPTQGAAAMLGAAVCSAFGSVYFEKMLKGDRTPSLWVRNTQLAVHASICGALTVLLQPVNPRIAAGGRFYGVDGVVWTFILLSGSGGIVIAVVVKYADNILRNFAGAVALLLTALGSWFFYSFELTAAFMVGALLVVLASLLYGDACPSPPQACVESCPGGAWLSRQTRELRRIAPTTPGAAEETEPIIAEQTTERHPEVRAESAASESGGAALNGQPTSLGGERSER